MDTSIQTNNQVVAETSRFFQKVFMWMFAGLLVSGITAYVVAITPVIVNFIFGNPLVFYGLLLAEFGLVWGLVRMVDRVSPATATALFLGYAFATGLTLSVIFLLYTGTSIISTFFVGAGLFGIMAGYGYVTKTDLSSWGEILFIGLLGIIFASLVNLFLQNSRFDFIVSIIGVIIFTALTSYDIQKIKNLNIIGNEGTPQDKKEAIIGALTLYLDFINLFLRLLRLFGRRRS